MIFAAFFASTDFAEGGALADSGPVAFTGLARFRVLCATVSTGGVGASGVVATFAAVAAGLRAGWADDCLGAFSRLRLGRGA